MTAATGQRLERRRPSRAAEPASRARDRQARPTRCAGAVTDGPLETLFDSPGAPLPDTVREALEHHLGHDLARVRVHADDGAALLAEAVGAAAFVTGSHIFFGRGRYDVSTRAGRRLLGHEVSHVVDPGPTPGSLELSTCQEDRATAAVARDWTPVPAATASSGTAAEPTRNARAELPTRRHGDHAPSGARGTVRVVDLILRLLTQTLRTDPDDVSGRVRAQLARLSADVRDAVVQQGRLRLSATEFGRLDAVLAMEPAPAAALATPETGPAPDPEDSRDRDDQHRHDNPHDEGRGRAHLADTTTTTGRQAPGPLASDGAALAGALTSHNVPEPAKGTGQGGPLADDSIGQGRPAPVPGIVADRAAPQQRPAGPVGGPPAPAAPTGGATVSIPTPEGDAGAARDGTADGAVPGPASVADQREDPAVVETDDAEREREEVDPAEVPPAAEPPEQAAEPPEQAAAQTEPAEPEEAAPATVEEEPDGVGGGTDDAGGTEEAGGTEDAAGGPGGCLPAPAPRVDLDAPAPGCGPPAGAAPAPADPEPEPPQVASLPPQQALDTVGSLPPTALKASLPQVGASASAAVAGQREQQAPPSMPRPSGAPAAIDVTAPLKAVAHKAYGGPTATDKAHPRGSRAAPPAPGPPVPSPDAPSPTANTPVVQLPGDQPLTERDVARVTDAVDGMPVTDPQLDVTAGEPERLDRTADADPALIGRQKANVDAEAARAADQGATDVAEPLGEAGIRPHVPPKTLTAAPPGDTPCDGATARKGDRQGGTPPGKYPRKAVDAIATEELGDRLRTAVTAAGEGFASAEQSKDETQQTAREQAQQEIDGGVRDSNTEQVDLRRGAIAHSVRLRGQWTVEQRKALDVASADSDSAVATGAKAVAQHTLEGQRNARQEVDNANSRIRREREEAERKARQEKAKAKKKSRGGILGWIGDKVHRFINAIKSFIKDVFEAARKAVRGLIKAAKTLVHKAIQAARALVVGAIKLAGDALLVVGDTMLAAFPAARAKFRKKVRETVDRATHAVNAAADALERKVQAALDQLGHDLDCALQALEGAFLAALDALEKAVDAVLDAVGKFLDMLGDWLSIISDVASDPWGWLKKLGRAAVDGVRNCLWGALKRAVRQWFNDKVEEVVGVGKLVINVLLKGCMKLTDIGRMAWEAVKAALPGILVQLLIEKLVALIIPAGGAISLIIDGLRAAWGAVSRILAAFGKFIAFLKSVRSGQGAPAFADVVAAAAVAVLDFLSNFLIGKLKGAAQGVGGRLKGLAERMSKALVGGARAVRTGATRVARAGLGLARRGAGALARGGRRLREAARRGLRTVARTVDPRRVARAVARSRVAAALRRTVGRGRGWATKRVDRLRAWREQRRAARALGAERRLDAALGVVGPALAHLPAGGLGRVLLWARFQLWRVRYRLSAVTIEAGTDEPEIVLRINPSRKAGRIAIPALKRHELVSRIAERLDPAPPDPLVGGSNKAAFRAAVAARILATPGHPLAFLVTGSGRLRRPRTRQHGDLANRPDVIEAGHVMSEWMAVRSGAAQRLVIMTASVNQEFNTTVEQKGAALAGVSVLDVAGIAVERRSAEDMLAWLRAQNPAAADVLARHLRAARLVRFGERRASGVISIGGLSADERRALLRWMGNRAFSHLREVVPAGVRYLEARRAARRGASR